MPTITLNRKVLDNLLGKKYSDEKLRDRISYLGTGLEGMNENEIIVEIFPNRPDLLSDQGFARALGSFMGIKTGLKKFNVTRSEHKLIVEPSVKEVRPYTACAIVKGINFSEEKIKEVIQIQEKLHITYGRNRKKVAIGIYPFEKIKTPIRFVAMKPEDIHFRPLEFPRELNGRQILSQHPTGREYGHLLEGQAKFPIFIDAQDKILSMPPIINSHDVGKIDQTTRDVFIECSGFDYDVLSKCLNMIVTALADMGGAIYSMEIDFYGKKVVSPNLSPAEFKVNLGYINKRLGLRLKEKDIKQLFERMGHGYTQGKVSVAAYRADIMHQADLAEDIAIAYGYENFSEELPKISTIASEDKLENFKRKVSEIMAGQGLLECNVYHLTNKEYQMKLMNFNGEPIELSNALNLEYNVLTSWLIPSLMSVLRNNKHNDYPHNIYTISRTFKKSNITETGVGEEEKLASCLCSDTADYTRIRQVMDYLLRMLGIKFQVEETSHTSFIAGRVGKVVAGDKEIGIIGEVHPQVIGNWSIELPVCAFELNLSELIKLLR